MLHRARPMDSRLLRGHSYWQVWVGGKTASGDGWAFIEGIPAGGGEALLNPCDKWFCNPAHFNRSGTRVFATKYDRSTNEVRNARLRMHLVMEQCVLGLIGHSFHSLL